MKRLFIKYPATFFYGIAGIIAGLIRAVTHPTEPDLAAYIIGIIALTAYGIYVDWTHRNDSENAMGIRQTTGVAT
jgi:hypothetical protein